MSRRRSAHAVALCALLAFVVLATSVPAFAQRISNRVDRRPPGASPTRLTPRDSRPLAKGPTVPGTRRVVQDFEQKVEPDGSIIGTPVELELGIPETVAEIQARQLEFDKSGIVEEREAEDRPLINPAREFNPNNPDSPEAPQWPIPDGEISASKTDATLNPQTIGTSFTGPTLADSGFLPPDSMGAVGPTQYIVIINGRIRSYAKSTGTADGVVNATTDAFFNSVRNGSGTSDPRIRYDRLSARWFVVIINVSTPNRILLAVSNTSTITVSTVWTFFFIPIDTTPPTISNTCLFDYPTLGIDANALYIGGNNFCGSPSQTFNSTDGYVIRKSSMLSGGPIVVTVFRGLAAAGGAGPYTPQGVDNYDPAATEGYFIGVDNVAFGTLQLRRVSNPGGTPTISANIPITVSSTSFPVAVPQAGNPLVTLDALDDRLFAAHIRNGRLWTAHNIAVDTTGAAVTTGTVRRDACRWYELQGIASPGTPSVVQSGTVFDSTATNPLFFWIPSIMVSGQGHAAMGFSRAGRANRADAYTNGRLAGDTLGTLQTPTALTASSTKYDTSFPNPERWGDYSYTSLDPNDDQTMWTVQEFCNATNSYAVRIAQLIAPPPATPDVASPGYVLPNQSNVNVTITGLASDISAGAGYFDTSPSGLWNPNRITATVSDGVTVNSVTYVDPTTVVLNISTTGAPVDTNPNIVTITNPDGQSRSAGIFNVFAPASVGLESFTAASASPGSGGDGSVTVSWTTGYEVNNLGFNLYRVTRSGRELLTPQLIAGSALRSNATAPSAGPRVYTYTDRPPRGTRGVRYVLEDVDLNGTATLHGPIRVTRGVAGSATAASASQPLTIDQVASFGASSEPAPFAQVPIDVDPPAFDKLADTAGPAGSAVKLSVRQQGWYSVSGADLVAAGLDPATNPQLLQLWADGKQIAALVRGESDGRLDAADTIEFFGSGLDLPSTGTRTYWVVAGSTAGSRIRQQIAPGQASATASFPFTVERKDRLVYFSSLRNGDADNFLGEIVTSSPVDQTLAVQHLDASRSSTLDLSIRGVTNGPHAVNVTFNGVAVGSIAFRGTELGQLRVTLPAAAVHEGQNVVGLVAVGPGYDISAVDSIRLTYYHTALADSDVLRLTASGSSRGASVTVGGFTQPTIRVVDITTPSQPVELSGSIAAAGGGYAASVLAPPGQRTLYAFTDSEVLHPSAIAADRPSSLRTFDGADLVIVAPRAFFAALAPLVAARQAQGLSVALVDLEDVFDEFSYGERVPLALRQFASVASTSWRVRARFLLLAGDASFDPREFLGHGPSDIVPTKLIDTTFMETASDDWFVDFDSDGAPELAVGRLPVRTAAETAALVTKLLAYDGASSPPSGALVVSDRPDTYDFHAASLRLAQLLPAGTPFTEIRRDQAGDAATHAAVVAGIDAGPRLLTWNGHGSLTLWRGDILTNADASVVSNGARLPLMSSMTCLNGYFIDPTLPCISEALLATQQGGVVGAWSGSGMANPEAYTGLNEELYRQLFAGGAVTLGEAILRAKQAALDVEARKTWIFLGDPSSRLR